ncbi:MAG: hypothetical protein ACOX88_00285 [Christensenellales bacterium]|jgi:hypothetical protein
MSYISAIFDRADIQHIREYLLSGGKLLQVDHQPYEQRLAEGMDQAVKRIQTYFPDQAEEIEDSLIQAVSVYQDVYMEIGLRAGIVLAAQIFNLGK